MHSSLFLQWKSLPWLAARKREESVLIMQIKRELDSLKEIWLLDSCQDIDFKNIQIKQLTMEEVKLFFQGLIKWSEITSIYNI